uniref:Uncharacterized protein n=1 Tax=Fagus sylvatica TaxID=28930 RepID=A0A2N9IRR8_FAGSY
MSDFDVLGTVGKLALPTFARFQNLRKSELGLVRYGPANRGHRSVFGPFEGSFPIRIPASPDQLVASQEDSVRKRGNVGGRIPELSAKPYFVGLFSRAWSRSVRFSFRSGQRSGQTLVKLGQPWSNLVEFGQSPPNSGKCIPEYILRVSGQGGPQSGWEWLGQTSVNPSQTWSTLVKPGQTLGNVSRTFFLGVFDVARLRRIMLARSGLSRFVCRHPRKSRGKACTPRAGPSRATRYGPVRATVHATWRSYPPRQPPIKSSLVFVHVPFSDPIFKGSFGGLLVLKMGHAAYRRKALDVYFPTIPVKRGNATGEPRVPRRSWSRYLSNAPGLADQLVASREDSAREGGSCAAYFWKVPDSRESELGFARYGPANRGHRSVFGPFEDSFPIGIPARPGKILAIREFHVVHECVFFPTCPGLRINLLRVRKTLRAKRGNVGRKVLEFSAQPYFVGLFLRAWPCTEASLGSQDMILRIEAVGMFLMPREWSRSGQFDSAFGLVNGLVKPGQPWSNLVEFDQSSPNSGKCIPDHILRVSGHGGPWSGRKRLGQTLVNPGQTWSTLVKLGQTSGDVSRIFFLGLFDVASLRRIRPARFGLSRFACQHSRKSRG